MEFTAFKKALTDHYLDSEIEEITFLLLDWVQTEIADTALQSQSLTHARMGRSILKKKRQTKYTDEEFEVEVNKWWDKLTEYLHAIRQYLREQEAKSAAEHSQPEMVRKVRRALQDLNYKKEILTFRQFHAGARKNRGVFLINGAQYYGQNWLYRLLLEQLGRTRQSRPVREIPLDFSSVTPVNLFLFELQHVFGLNDQGSEAANLAALTDTILDIWETDQSLVFRIEMNGQIPPPALKQFLEKFWNPLYERSKQRQSENFLLLFLIFGHPLTLPTVSPPPPGSLVLSREITDDWVPQQPLLLDIQLLNLTEVNRWLDGRLLEFEDLLDPPAVARELMQNQDTSLPEIVMMGFCRRYQLSFHHDILRT